MIEWDTLRRFGGCRRWWEVIVTVVVIGCVGDQPIDSVPSVDSDRDYIYDVIETEATNVALYHFVVGLIDHDPSYPTGTPTYGTLENGLNLPDANAGYYHYLGISPINTDDWGTGNTLNAVLQVGGWWDGLGSTPKRACRSWSNSVGWTPTRRFGVGDISQGDTLHRRYGGPFIEQVGGHDSLQHEWHRQGLDVDVRYLRLDRTEEGLNVFNYPSQLDRNGTVDLLNCFLSLPNVELILMDTLYTGIPPDPGGVIRHAEGHRDHFHVRFYDFPITW